MALDLLLGNGTDDTNLMIIADYARKQDETTGQCLSGYYNRKVNEILKQANYTIEQCYRTCIIKNYIQGIGVNTWGRDKKLLREFLSENNITQDFYIDHLVREINDIKPAIILALGEYALRVLTGKEGITKWRGSVLPLNPDLLTRKDNFVDYNLGNRIKVVAAQHPYDIHTDESFQYLMRLDYKKAIDLLCQPNKPIDYHEIFIARSHTDLLNFLKLYPDEPPEMTCDIETQYGFPTCTGISFDGFRGICIPMYGSKIDLLERCRMWYVLCNLLNNPRIGKLNQNISYDKRILQRFGFRINPIIWDTMLAAHTIAPEFPKRLEFLTSIYTDMSFYKDEGRDYDPRHDDIDQLYNYNVKDAITTYQIYKKQIEDLKELDLYDFFKDFVMPLMHVYYNLESIGLKIDIGKRDELIAKYESLYELKYDELKVITSKAINMNSPSQLGKFMEENNFPVLRHRVESGFMVVNTDYESLSKMRISPETEYKQCKLPYNQAIRFINLTLLLRRIDKVLEYANVGIHPWGRVHTSVKLGGTTSGRTSNGQTSDGIPIYKEEKGKLLIKFKQLGQSFQTVTKHGFIIEGEDDPDIEEGIIGKDIRDMYIPDKGHALVEIDGSQAEARVCDVLGEDWESLEEYNKLDKHCKTASMIFTDFTYEDIFRMSKIEKSNEGLFMRNIGKHSKHAKNNGMDAYAFAQRYLHTASMRHSIALAKVILNQINKAYPNIEEVFHKQVEEKIRTIRCLWNPFGRKRMFFKKITKHYLNVAYSWLPQSIISDQTKKAMLEISSKIDNTRAWLVAENHDSVTALVKCGYIREYINIAIPAMQRGIDMRNCVLSRDYELIIPAEVSIGRTRWGQMSEIKLKKLREIPLKTGQHI